MKVGALVILLRNLDQSNGLKVANDHFSHRTTSYRGTFAGRRSRWRVADHSSYSADQFGRRFGVYADAQAVSGAAVFCYDCEQIARTLIADCRACDIAISAPTGVINASRFLIENPLRRSHATFSIRCSCPAETCEQRYRVDQDKIGGKEGVGKNG